MYENQMEQAFSGMKADSGYDRVESWKAAKPVTAGVFVGRTDKESVAPGKNWGIVGIALHSHCIGDYKIDDCVSVMTIGLAWVQVSDKDKSVVNKGVKINASGQLDSTATDTINNAAVRDIITTQNGKLACIEVLAAMTAA